MKDLNNIEDWYRDELSNYNVEPNKNVWDALADDLDANSPLTDENVSEWYKKEAAKLEERPDYRVWEKLATKLDTASVWDKLSVSLTRYEQYIWWRNFALRGSAILLLLGGSYAAFQEFDADSIIADNNKIIASQIQKETKKTSTHTKQTIAKSITTNIGENSFTNKDNKSKKPTISKVNNNTTNSSLSNSPNKNGITNNEVYAKVNSITAAQVGTTTFNKLELKPTKKGISEKDITAGYTKKEFLVKKKKNKILFNNKRFSSHFAFGVYARRFYLGVNFGFKKQGMITTLKNNPGLGEFKQQSFLNFGNTLGSTLGWIVSDKLNVETNLNFISTAGYNSSFSNENTSFEEELKLNYTTLSILAKKMSNKSTFDNKKYSTNLIGGIYAGYLVTSSSIVNGTSFDNNSYKNTDVGIILGIEQDRYITKSFVITPGIRYQQGLINIANGNSAYQSARNFAIEFNLGIKYIFLKRG